jgi:hypothetical protein
MIHSATEARGAHRLVAEAACVGVLVIVVHLLFRLSAGFLVGVLNDDGVYVTLGKAIAQGAGYRSIHLVDAPLHLKYPPGLPLLLAAPWALGGTLAAVQATVAVLHPLVTGGAAALIWWVGRRWLEVSAWPLAVCAVAPLTLDGTIQYFNIALTEPYLVIGWAAALALAAPICAPGVATQRLGRAVALGLVVAGTTLFRSVGIALVAAVLLALAVHRRWREAAAFAAAALAPLLLWETLQASWMTREPVSRQLDDLSYWRWLGVNRPLAFVGHAAPVVAANGVEYVGLLASQLFSNQWFGVVVVLAVAGAVAVACVRLWRSHTALVASTLSATALTLVWPFVQDRLVLPLLPFLGLLAATTVETGARRAPARLKLALPAALGLAALAVTLRQVELRAAAARVYETRAPVADEDRSAVLMLALRSRFISHTVGWVRALTVPEDRIMVDAPASVYLYTGRRAVAAVPPERLLGSSVFDVPGRYLASHMLADSLALVVWAPPAPGLERDIVTIQARCPDALRREGPVFPAFFRIRRDERCLREQVLAAGAAVRAR